MTGKRDWYEKFSRVLGWERNKKWKIAYLFAGILTGFLIWVTAIYSLMGLITKFSPQAIGISLGIWAIAILGEAAILTLFFGHRDLKSVIKNRVFKWSAVAIICLIVIIFAVSLIMLITHPISIGPW